MRYTRDSRSSFDVASARPGNAEQLIQVCADLDAAGTCLRELHGLPSAAREHSRATLHVIALTASTAPPLPDHVHLPCAAGRLWQDGSSNQ
jgi:hypothetical protein